MKIYTVNGFPRSGKDTFCDFVTTLVNPFGITVSTVDKVKDVAKYVGWNGEKTPENRKFLSDLKDLLTQWNDVPVKDVITHLKREEAEWRAYMKYNGDGVGFIMCREPPELDRFKNEFGAKSILIWRPDVAGVQSNHADSEVLNYNYDIVIENAGDLTNLAQQAEEFIQKEKLFYFTERHVFVNLFGEIEIQ